MHQFCVYLDWAGWKPEVWAAWAQALLSAMAILAAAAIAKWQRVSELQEKAKGDALVARSLAMAVLRDMNKLAERIDRGRRSVPVKQGPEEGRTIEAVQVPQRLWDAAREMHLLGEPGGEVITALFHVQESRQHIAPAGQGKYTLWGDDKDAYLQSLHEAATACAVATIGLRSMLDPHH